MTRIDDPHGMKLRLSAQRALLGNVPESLRAASVQYEGDAVWCRFVFDVEPTEAELDCLSVAATEILADYAEGVSIVEEVRVVDAAQETTPLRHLVFARKEPDASTRTHPAWVTRGKSIRELIAELQTFEDVELEVRLSVDDGASWKPISLVAKEHAGDAAFCGLSNVEVSRPRASADDAR